MSGNVVYVDSSNNPFKDINGTVMPITTSPYNDIYNSQAYAVIQGSSQNDDYHLLNQTQTVVETASGGTDTVDLSASYRLPANVENLIVHQGSLAGPYNILSGQGNDTANLLIANVADDRAWATVNLNGGKGNDVLVDETSPTTTVQFVMPKGEGQDVIYGFKAGSGAGHDVAQLTGWGFTSPAQALAALQASGTSDTLLTATDGSKILFHGVTPGQFTPADFVVDLDRSQIGALTFSQEFNGAAGPLNQLGGGNQAVGGPTTLRDPYLAATDPHSQGVWRADLGYQGVDGEGSYKEVNTGEYQLYTSPYYRHENLGLTPFSQDGQGDLVITADTTAHVMAQSGAPASAFQFGSDTFNYTSGLLSTEPNGDGSSGFTQTYGYFEIRAELPAGAGTWPAFWLLPASHAWPPEIDIMEQEGGDKLSYQATVHSNDLPGGVAQDAGVFTGDATGQFHTYGLLWTPSTLTWTFDGAAVFSQATPADLQQPMYMLVNEAMGPGAAIDSQLPGQGKMVIDYVHAFAYAGGGSGSGQTINGSGGHQALTGGAGDDTITGSQQGDDTLTGGGGADHFRWIYTNWDPQTLTDFTPGVDKIDVSGLPGIAADPFAANQLYWTYDQPNDRLILYYDQDGDHQNGNFLGWLNHVSSLQQSDFIASGSGSGSGQTINGSGGHQALTGGAGDDTITGSQQGDDTLTGGGGADHFRWIYTNWDPQTLTDFTPGVDKIDVSGLPGIAADPFAANQLYWTYDQPNDRLILYYDQDGDHQNGNFLGWLNHVSSLQQSDFIG